MSNKMEVSYLDLNDNEITLSPATVKKYICNNPSITDSEMAMFLKLCQHQKLNPFLREVYLVKYGSAPASMITGKETFLKRAKRDARYQGHKCSIEGEIPNMTATAEVYVKDYQTPITCTVWYEEYVGLKRDGTPTGMWSSKPRTMLQKVALVQALREAFPDTFGGMYSQEEINTIDADKLPTNSIIIEETEPEQPEERVSKERNDGEYGEVENIGTVKVHDENEVMPKALTESTKSKNKVDLVKEQFNAKLVWEAPDTSVAVPERPEELDGDTVNSEWVDYIVAKLQFMVSKSITVDHLEYYVGKYAYAWKEQQIGLLNKLGIDLVTKKKSLQDVFEKYCKQQLD